MYDINLVRPHPYDNAARSHTRGSMTIEDNPSSAGDRKMERLDMIQPKKEVNRIESNRTQRFETARRCGRSERHARKLTIQGRVTINATDANGEGQIGRITHRSHQ